METAIGIIAILLLLVSFVCLILGLIQPKIFSRFFKNGVNRKKTSLIFGSILIICLIPIGFLSTGTPSLAKMKTPTNQKNVVISGKTSYKNSVIKVYRNGEAIAELKADDKGSFSTSIELKEGENKIKVSATNDKSKTKTSSESIVVLDIIPPNLEIVQPQSSIDTPLITIEGNSEKDATIIIESELKEINRTTVKNNSFEMLIDNLAEGENKFTIKAIDRADNYSSAKDFTIIYKKPISKEEVKTEPTKEETTSNNPSAETSVSVTRNDLIKLFPELTFSKKTPVDGKENYLAQSTNKLVLIQIIGSENVLAEISMTTMFSSDSVNESEVNSEYKDRLLNKLTPNLGMFPDITKEKDTKTVDGFDVVFTTTTLGSGVFSEAYSFKPTK